MIDHNHFICHFIFGGHLLNIPMIQIILEYLIVSIICFFFTLISIYRAPTDIELWGKETD